MDVLKATMLFTVALVVAMFIMSQRMEISSLTIKNITLKQGYELSIAQERLKSIAALQLKCGEDTHE